MSTDGVEDFPTMSLGMYSVLCVSTEYLGIVRQFVGKGMVGHVGDSRFKYWQ